MAIEQCYWQCNKCLWNINEIVSSIEKRFDEKEEKHYWFPEECFTIKKKQTKKIKNYFLNTIIIYHFHHK